MNSTSVGEIMHAGHLPWNWRRNTPHMQRNTTSVNPTATRGHYKDPWAHKRPKPTQFGQTPRAPNSRPTYQRPCVGFSFILEVGCGRYPRIFSLKPTLWTYIRRGGALIQDTHSKEQITSPSFIFFSHSGVRIRIELSLVLQSPIRELVS